MTHYLTAASLLGALAMGVVEAHATPEDVSRCVPLGEPLTAEMKTFIRDSSLEPRVSCKGSKCHVTVAVRGVNGRTVDLGTFNRKSGSGYLCIWPPGISGPGFAQSLAGQPASACAEDYSLVRIGVRRDEFGWSQLAYIDALYSDGKSKESPAICMDKGYVKHHHTSIPGMTSGGPTYQFATDRAAVRHTIPPHAD